MLRQKNRPKLVLSLIVGLIVIILFFWADARFFSNSALSPVQAPHSAQSTTGSHVPPVQSPEAHIDAQRQIQLVNDDLLKQPISNNSTLAQEEVTKLEELHHQLNQQQSMLQAQHEDANQLIQLKQEQIKLLEAQLN